MSDTTQSAAEAQADVYRRLGGVARLRLAFEISMVARELSLARLRAQHPEWSERELYSELARYALLSSPRRERGG